MPRYKLLLEYDGTRYSGWQVQRNAKGIQGMLITAAREGFGDVGEVMGSGRTDAGVHALGQVAHIDIPTSLPSERIMFTLNDRLPYDINVLGVTPVEPRFHARHGATGRSYLFQIARRRTAFGKNYVWWIKDRLDVGAMRRASLPLQGMHDYRSFTDAELEEGEGKVLVESVEMRENEEMILIRIRASHFLRKMVRRIVGTLVEIGRGELPVETIAEALEMPQRRLLTYTAPPSGLYLEQVLYKGERYSDDLHPAMWVG